jgi:hypothetical protein
MSKPIVNQEHREAEQMEANRERDEFIATLSKTDQAKFAAVEKAVRLLVKADVPFYMFPQLPSLQFKGKQQIWQWNSLVAKVQYDKSGKPTKESDKENGFYHEAFFSFIFNQFKHLFKGESVEEKLTYMPYFFHYCLTKFSLYLDDEKKDDSNDN